MRSHRRRGAPPLLLALALALLPGWSRASGFEDLHSIEQFKRLFNHDAGRPRLLLLLSPT